MKSNSYADSSRCWLVISCSFKNELNKFDYLSTQGRNIPVDDLMSSQNMIKQLHGSPFYNEGEIIFCSLFSY